MHLKVTSIVLMSVDKTPAWQALAKHAETQKKEHLAELFRQDPNRFENYSYQTDTFLLDLSKQRITSETLELLGDLAEQQQLGKWIDKLVNGATVNHSEQRAALHTALRQPLDKPLLVDGQDVVFDVHSSLLKMELLVAQIHNAQWRGYSGKPITDVVNIGVGGSNLGPLMACEALSGDTHAREISVHFVSSMDGSELSTLLGGLDAASTLFIIASKSFSTIDTLANAKTAREWLVTASKKPVELINQHHFIAVTASPEKAMKWGVPDRNQLLFWDWVGGRYSLWSTIGLPIALKIGMAGFQAMLKGAHDMDVHFRESPFKENLPVLLALMGVWNINFLNIHAHAVLPYDGRLATLPGYLEQLEMESNGKNVNHAGERVAYNTCPILWGEIGSNAQHAFYQLLHQGTEPVMSDFIASSQRYQKQGDELKEQHKLSLVNCLAQSRLLALGDAVQDDDENTPYFKRYFGNQPSTTILFDELTPEVFGGLIALYEHKVYVQSVIWEINPFDQWGVELGKQMATSLLPGFEGTVDETVDASTKGLLKYILRKQGIRDEN